jgi:hypothetical protein
MSAQLVGDHPVDHSNSFRYFLEGKKKKKNLRSSLKWKNCQLAKTLMLEMESPGDSQLGSCKTAG